MLKRVMLALTLMLVAAGAGINLGVSEAQAGHPGQPNDWNRFRYYPYVYYPHNFQKPKQFNNMYYRYPQNMRIPVYNKSWHNFYPTERPYHSGHHFILDVL